MRTIARLRGPASVVVMLLAAAEARASAPSNETASDDASIGTTPARESSQKPARAPSPSAPAPSSGSALGVAETSISGEYESPEQRDRWASLPIASDPPGDWAVLHAGLRPHLGTFGGIATFALAHARTERFYGGFSLAAVRNDAGAHVGIAQLALGRNLADDFIGGLQLSVSENRARSFVGLGQTSLGYNRALEATAIAQIGLYNRAKSFVGVAQVGPYNRTDVSFGGLAQVGAMNRAEAFTGVAQLGPYNRVEDGFGGIGQFGLVNHTRGSFTGVGQVGIVNLGGRCGLSLARCATREGADESHTTRFVGLAQAGAISFVDGDFYGIGQAGLASHTSGNFRGIVQVGAVSAGAEDFRGLAQIAPYAASTRSMGFQLGGGTIATEEHTGIQVGALGTRAKTIHGAQLGLVNLADRVNGVQIGVFNHTNSLRGVQIGLGNHAEDGVLAWTALLNMGFGDDDGREARDDRNAEYAAPPPAYRAR